MSSAEREKCSFMLRLNGVRSGAVECFSCLFVLLRGLKSASDENPWQWHIRRGFFKVSSPCDLHASHSSPLKYPRKNDREDGWPLTSGASEVSSRCSAPLVIQHISTNHQTQQDETQPTRWHPNNLNKHDQSKINEASFFFQSKKCPCILQEWSLINVFLLNWIKYSSWIEWRNLQEWSQTRVSVWCPLEEIYYSHSVCAAKVTKSPVPHAMRSFLNPYTTQFIVVFNNVWLAASWRSCPKCIYFLSDACPHYPVIPCGPTTQTAPTVISLTFGPLPRPQRQWRPLPPPYSPRKVLPLPLLHSPFLFSTVFPSRCCTYLVHTLVSLLTRTSGKG